MKRLLCVMIVLTALLLSACRPSHALFTTRAASSDQYTAAEKQIDRKTRLYDDARLLTDNQRTTVSTMLDYMSNKRGIDITAAIIDTTGGADLLNYARFLYDRRGYGYGGTEDGLLLLLAHKDRQVAVTTAGRCVNIYSDAVVTSMLREITPLLTDEDFAGAVCTYARLTDELYNNKASANMIN